MRSFFSVLVLLLLVNVLSGQCELFGTILDENGAPLSGANIVLPELNKGAISNSDGKFIIEDISEGTYEINVSYIGFEEERRQVKVKGDVARYQLKFFMKKAIFSFDELVIQSARVEKDAPFAFEVISGDELAENNSGQDVPFLLKWTPSMVATSDAGAGVGYTGMRIRGSDGERINVTINGIPLNDSESQRVYWVDLPDFAGSTDDIQIQRGVGTSTNGSGAFGASINLSTQDLKEKPYTGISAATGSFNTWKRSLNFGSGILRDHFSINARLSKITSDGYIDRASSDLSSYAISGVYRGHKSMLRFNLFSGHEITYQAWYGIGEELALDAKTRTYNPAGTDKVGTPYENQVDNYGQKHYQLLHDWQITDNFKMQSALHYTQGGGYYEEYKGDEDYRDYGLDNPVTPDPTLTNDLIRRRWLTNDFYGGLLTGVFTSSDLRSQITFGGAYHQYIGRHFGEVIWARYAASSEINHIYYDNDATKNDGNVFAKVAHKLRPNFQIFGDLQLRTVDYSFFGVKDDFTRGMQTVNYLFFNPKVGLSYKVNSYLDSYLSVAVANREPNRNDLVDTPTSKQPTAERLLDVEAGVNGGVEKIGWKVNLFFMSYENQLALTGRINDVGEYTRINVPNSSRQGIELQTKWMPTTKFELGINATLSRNKVDAFDEYIDTYDTDFNWLQQSIVSHQNTDLAFSPAIMGSAMIAYAPGNSGVKFNLQTKYVGKQYVDLAMDENNHLPAYSFTDLSVSYLVPWKLTNKLKLTFFAKNIFDQLYANNAWSYRYRIGTDDFVDKGLYPQAGRNYYLMLNCTF